MHNAANNTEKYEGKSPLGICAAVCAGNIVSPPTKPVGSTGEMKVELRGEDIKGADAGRTIAGVMCSIFSGWLAAVRVVTVTTAVPGSR